MSMSEDSMRELMERPPFLKTLHLSDWAWAVLVVIAAIFTHVTYSSLMDSYEIGILYLSAITMVVMGWRWRALQVLTLVVGGLSLFAINLYGNELGLAQTNFFLKFLISSQSAIMWMSALYVLATVVYFLGLFRRSEFINKVASSMVWSGTAMGFIGLMVRWRESYLIHADVGHIPVSNLYEVFILFAVMTALIYLHYERRYKTRALGGFVMLVISAAVGFILWYAFSKGAHEIQPLVPALKSYWMKIHVPANFVGYGAFALAAMVGVAYLLLDSRRTANPDGFFSSRMPALDILDDIMYKSIALGFAFFTIATVLGAMWAAEAWGGYWSWDPKETWALIVWLNYAAWLHLRLTKGWRGRPLAWWAVVGLFVTLFAFLGVNMFLSGLHSYGEL
ncbi:MAG: c-type cytochrome biogenesis protein CcsB [Gammaproteobacteria bacterium]|nr:c-type cytochrome biogenesis protein CcsB [Gammaproteobacteria bacterium]